MIFDRSGNGQPVATGHSDFWQSRRDRLYAGGLGKANLKKKPNLLEHHVPCLITCDINMNLLKKEWEKEQRECVNESLKKFHLVKMSHKFINILLLFVGSNFERSNISLKH